jgi:DNA repair protein RadC
MPAQHSTKIKLVTLKIEDHKHGQELSTPGVVAQHARSVIGNSDREHLLTYHLNTHHEIISYETASIGTLTSSLIHPREIFKAAILSNAACIIVVHNHPSGNPRPSVQDKSACKRINDAAKILGLFLLDFVIVTITENYSFGTSGKLDAGTQQNQ